MDVSEHIRQDLQPYVCTYEKCPDEGRMYASRHAWLEHERLVHRRIWRCFEHRSFISNSKDSLEQHFVDCHKGLDRQQIENLLDLAETTVADDRQTCPFCYSVGPFDKGFYNHMAFHQEQLATDDSSFDGHDGVKNVNKSLLHAAKIGDEAAVRLLLEKGAELESKDDDGWTPLACAAMNGHEAVVSLLLEKGAELESKDDDGWTPLAWAAMNGHEAVVSLLLEKGAELESKVDDGWTPLTCAAMNGHEAVVSLLLEKGAELESKDDDGWTPLAWAAMNGHEAVVSLLLEKGAELESKDDDGLTPLAWAAKNGHEAVVKQLLATDSVDVNSNDNNGRTPLAWAVQNDNEAVVRLLLDTDGVDVNSNDKNSMTPLALAAKNGYQAVVRLLLDTESIDVDSKDKTTQAEGSVTALYHASFAGHANIARMLLDGDADINTQGGIYGSPLQAASLRGHEEVVQMLLDYGADVDAQGGNYGTALYAASFGGHEKVTHMLLDRGADINNRGGEYGSALQAASAGAHEKVVRMLLDRGADVNSQGGEYGNALRAASSRGHENIVQMLLDHGANVEAQGGEDGSVLPATTVGLGIAGARHLCQQLLSDLNGIKTSPKNIEPLTDNVRSLNLALTSVQSIHDSVWPCLGPSFFEDAKSIITECTATCARTNRIIQRWTYRSDDDSRSWVDNSQTGFFEQTQIDLMNQEIHTYGTKVMRVASIVTLIISDNPLHTPSNPPPHKIRRINRPQIHFCVCGARFVEEAPPEWAHEDALVDVEGYVGGV
ncbi:Ankyrin repeat domain-containing protein 50 [Penicillium subrubescens]|uniref:Ankyrin repeat domain-containing protein 50 n=1 Tax=Penicillium subrubescens TaxID=1316194 RepID=A0A1Q5U391_9EURO|nr:Ankyrin repeat domain-containing protein 50 [Penicillium subrubescens]